MLINVASDDKDEGDEPDSHDPEPHDDSLVAQIDEQMQKLELHHGKNFNTKMHQLMQGEQLLLPYIININIHNSSYGNNHSYVYICIYTG